jgi:hypothetical protein
MVLDTTITEEGQKPCTVPCAGIFDNLGLLAEAARVVDAASPEVEAKKPSSVPDTGAKVKKALPHHRRRGGLNGCTLFKQYKKYCIVKREVTLDDFVENLFVYAKEVRHLSMCKGELARAGAGGIDARLLNMWKELSPEQRQEYNVRALEVKYKTAIIFRGHKLVDFATASIKLPASPLKCGLGGGVYTKEQVVTAPDPSYVPILDVKERRRWAAAEWNAANANPEPKHSRPPRVRPPKSDKASRKRAVGIANDSKKARAKEAERKRVEREEEKKTDHTVKFSSTAEGRTRSRSQPRTVHFSRFFNGRL